MNKIIVGLALLLTMSIKLIAQDNEHTEELKGELTGQWRTFYMSTHNKGELKDFYTLATGGKIQYIQPIGKHFRIGTAFYTSANLGIQDLTKEDDITGRGSRYEGAMYDVRNLNDRFIFLIGEAYLQYNSEKHDLKVGRMKLNTPLINPTDGWMIPTLEQGIWYEYKPNSNYTFRMGAINATARATDKFNGIGDAIGTFPGGRNPDGTPSNYNGNTDSEYVAIGNVDWKPSDKVKVEVWDFLIDNISNTFLIKPSIGINDRGTKLSFEWLHQNKVGNGGNDDPSMRYFADARSNVIGTQMEWKWSKSKFTIGYDRVLKGGRFIFPREWGRETLFTFQRRERTEGSANNHGLVLAHERSFKWNQAGLRTVTSIGHQWKPSLSNAAENRYSMPDYTHLMVDLFYTHEKCKNLKPEFLFVYKFTGQDYMDTPGVIFNKADMFQLNFVLNYNF
jgi:hypothetical protein